MWQHRMLAVRLRFDVDTYLGYYHIIFNSFNYNNIENVCRFYDRENKNYLTMDEFKRLLEHIRKVRKSVLEEFIEADQYKEYMDIKS